MTGFYDIPGDELKTLAASIVRDDVGMLDLRMLNTFLGAVAVMKNFKGNAHAAEAVQPMVEMTLLKRLRNKFTVESLDRTTIKYSLSALSTLSTWMNTFGGGRRAMLEPLRDVLDAGIANGAGPRMFTQKQVAGALHCYAVCGDKAPVSEETLKALITAARKGGFRKSKSPHRYRGTELSNLVWSVATLENLRRGCFIFHVRFFQCIHSVHSHRRTLTP